MNITMNAVSVAYDTSIASSQAGPTSHADADLPQLQVMLRECVSEATKDAATIFHREDGMPRYVKDEVASQANGMLTEPLVELPEPCDPKPLQNTEGLREAFRELSGELTRSLVEAVRAELKNGDGEAAEGSGGSWMLAIARAMGKVLGEKASRMVELSEKIQGLSSGSGTGDASKMAAAAETQRLNTEFQATGQEFNLLQTTFSTAIKTLGEGMASVARRN